ncbi:546_t:CDS:2 [Paraglomus brasilianum]|uniref:546_t:CDS:1 n=1 Tax=Paraglomus brasilianum TaxID=144538 RepID=A0A9N9FB72_9GLOM|nr:546_t:CDS:2 [Paraglomus brasilianum]
MSKHTPNTKFPKDLSSPNKELEDVPFARISKTIINKIPDHPDTFLPVATLQRPVDKRRSGRLDEKYSDTHQEITNLVTECLPTSPSLSSSSSHPPPNYSQYQQNLGKSFKTLLRNKQPEIFELGWEEIRAREEESISNDEQCLSLPVHPTQPYRWRSPNNSASAAPLHNNLTSINSQMFSQTRSQTPVRFSSQLFSSNDETAQQPSTHTYTRGRIMHGWRTEIWERMLENTEKNKPIQHFGCKDHNESETGSDWSDWSDWSWIYLDEKDKVRILVQEFSFSFQSSPSSNIYTRQMVVKNLTFDDVAKTSSEVESRGEDSSSE